MQCAVFAGCPVEQTLTLRLRTHGAVDLTRSPRALTVFARGPAGPKRTWSDWEFVRPTGSVALVRRNVLAVELRIGQDGVYDGSGTLTVDGVIHLIEPFTFVVGAWKPV